ncbi:hypothetical protein E5676_scaffold1109G00010 [Cucumis melo var. makuwa]|uniref:Ty3-gypsy retrotransposon protein n=1 Tax=Cucumis melo var. makuwa TaxID=1194695 RepID=A0A5A7TW85_CUCMM|nr:hypothetical protein E6C27_scaffold83G00980 [Cucumis melo var. makuwa]TYK08894.1 hypothetical protein E5676_scaffold1109G00010 [Cucumis melo var. makuwa]
MPASSRTSPVLLQPTASAENGHRVLVKPNQNPLVVHPHAVGFEPPPHFNLLLLRSCTATSVFSLCVCPCPVATVRPPSPISRFTESRVSEVTLEFRSVTASVVGTNSPLFGWIHLDVELNKEFCYISGKGFLTTGPWTDTGNVDTDYELCRGGTKGLEISWVDCVYAVERWFSIDYGVMVRFIYGVEYLTGMVSFRIPRLICVSFEITRLICKGMARGRPARGKKDA